MRNLNLDQLDTFAQVIELGSFSATADRMDVSQPAVSLQIRQLEKRLGVRLIERVGRRAMPTPAGTELLMYARRIAELVLTAEDGLAPYSKGAIGRVRIGTGASACIHFLPPVFRELRHRFPGIEVIVQTGNTPEILKRLDENSIDLGLVTLPAPGRIFDVTPLFDDEFVVLSSRNEPDLPRAVTPAVLAHRPIVLYETGSQTRRIIDDWFSKAGLAVRPAMELSSVEAIKQLVSVGLGCGIVPRMAVNARSTPDLTIQSLTPRLSRRIGLVLRRDKPLHRGLRETIAALRLATTTKGKKALLDY